MNKRGQWDKKLQAAINHNILLKIYEFRSGRISCPFTLTFHFWSVNSLTRSKFADFWSKIADYCEKKHFFFALHGFRSHDLIIETIQLYLWATCKKKWYAVIYSLFAFIIAWTPSFITFGGTSWWACGEDADLRVLVVESRCLKRECWWCARVSFPLRNYEESPPHHLPCSQRCQLQRVCMAGNNKRTTCTIILAVEKPVHSMILTSPFFLFSLTISQHITFNLMTPLSPHNTSTTSPHHPFISSSDFSHSNDPL